MASNLKSPPEDRRPGPSWISGPEHRSFEFLNAAMRSWYVVATCAIVAGIVGWLYAQSRPVFYQATASLYFQEGGVSAGALGNSGGSGGDPDRNFATYTDLLQLPRLAARTAGRLGPGWTSSDVVGSYSVAAGGQSNVVNITATAPSAEEAAKIATAVVESGVEYFADSARKTATRSASIVRDQIAQLSRAERETEYAKALVARLSQLRLQAEAGGNAQVARRAQVPSSPASTPPHRTAILTAFAGLFLGLLLAQLRARLDPRLISVGDIRSAWNLPLLAVLPRDKVLAKAAFTGVQSDSLAPLAIARSSLGRQGDIDVRVIGVTSAIAAEGVSTVAAALAAAAAADGSSVLLIEGAHRNANVALGAPARLGDGQGGYIRGEADVRGMVRPAQTTPDLSFDVLPGSPTVNLVRSLGRDAEAFFGAARAAYDLVVVDLPPVTLSPDPLIVAEYLDGFLVVARPRFVAPAFAARARELLSQLETPMLGLIVNRARGQVKAAYGVPLHDPLRRN